MKKIWWKEVTGYQIYPRSFMDSNGDGIGDINGIISKLDYLKELGIDLVWVSPMYESPNDDNGYDISDYQDILKEFGTMQEFDLLLSEVHKRRMKLILDLVINHTSDEHPWFIESKSSKDNPKRDCYIWKDPKYDKNGKRMEPNNWESIFKGSAWEYSNETGQYYLHLFSKKQPDLNWENKEVRQEIYKLINWWLDKGIDGFRVDAISHIKKEEGLEDMPNPKKLKYVESFDKHMNVQGIHKHLEELKENTLSKYNIMTVGEANGVTTKDAHLWVGDEDGLGTGIPGPANTDTGVVEFCVNLKCWNKLNVSQVLGEKLDVPVHVDNDVNRYHAMGSLERVWERLQKHNWNSCRKRYRRRDSCKRQLGIGNKRGCR